MKVKITYLLLVLTAVAIIPMDAAAQCAMCKKVAGSDGARVAESLNNAILYLMFIPYIILIIFFRKRLFSFARQFFALWKV